jgi:hypothetical protein|tara:strand:+ start:5225 stop:5401 length:177 start_codon:yes stop_codon:yes gene_type:complete
MPARIEIPHDDWFVDKNRLTIDIKDPPEPEEITIHEKMYRIATASGTSTIGGSESVHK